MRSQLVENLVDDLAIGPQSDADKKRSGRYAPGLPQGRTAEAHPTTAAPTH
jgi:hypothetical protein